MITINKHLHVGTLCLQFVSENMHKQFLRRDN
jgi:hypothetical protein